MARLAAILALGAIGASAHPALHGHLHNKVKRDDGDVIVATIYGDVVSWTQSGDYYSPTPAADADANAVIATSSATSTSVYITSSTAASSAAVATATGSSSSTSTSTTNTTGTTVSTYTSFDDLCGSSSKRATLAQIEQVGNIGSTYMCNYVLPDSEEVASQYANTAKFYGATEDMTCYYWNKALSDGTLGGWYVSNNAYQTFTLAAGAVQYVAMEAGTQGAASCFPTSSGLETDSNGAIAGTWTEWTYQDVTTAWSAADASSIIAQGDDCSGCTVFGIEVCNLADLTTCSSISAAASVVLNAFDVTLAAADGLGINVGGAMGIEVNLGY